MYVHNHIIYTHICIYTHILMSPSFLSPVLLPNAEGADAVLGEVVGNLCSRDLHVMFII